MSKGRVMGPLLALICTCFRNNVIVTCKIVPFLCSSDIFFSNSQPSKSGLLKCWLKCHITKQLKDTSTFGTIFLQEHLKTNGPPRVTFAAPDTINYNSGSFIHLNWNRMFSILCKAKAFVFI